MPTLVLVLQLLVLIGVPKCGLISFWSLYKFALFICNVLGDSRDVLMISMLGVELGGNGIWNAWTILLL